MSRKHENARARDKKDRKRARRAPAEGIIKLKMQTPPPVPKEHRRDTADPMRCLDCGNNLAHDSGPCQGNSLHGFVIEAGRVLAGRKVERLEVGVWEGSAVQPWKKLEPGHPLPTGSNRAVSVWFEGGFRLTFMPEWGVLVNETGLAEQVAKAAAPKASEMCPKHYEPLVQGVCFKCAQDALKPPAPLPNGGELHDGIA